MNKNFVSWFPNLERDRTTCWTGIYGSHDRPGHLDNFAVTLIEPEKKHINMLCCGRKKVTKFIFDPLTFVSFLRWSDFQNFLFPSLQMRILWANIDFARMFTYVHDFLYSEFWVSNTQTNLRKPYTIPLNTISHDTSILRDIFTVYNILFFYDFPPIGNTKWLRHGKITQY